MWVAGAHHGSPRCELGRVRAVPLSPAIQLAPRDSTRSVQEKKKKRVNLLTSTGELISLETQFFLTTSESFSRTAPNGIPEQPQETATLGSWSSSICCRPVFLNFPKVVVTAGLSKVAPRSLESVL
jgi:hypothetical protein